MQYFKALFLVAVVLALTACGARDAIKGDIPEDYQAHLKAHPGDIRFNRPKIVWKVVHDRGPEWHVLPDEVYQQIYKDKFNEVWDTMKLDQGAGKAFDVVVEVPIFYDFPGRPMSYHHGNWSYMARVIDPDDGREIAHWGAGSNGLTAPYWGGLSEGNPSCQEMGHTVVVPQVVLATVVPLLGVKSGDFATFEEVVDTYARTGKNIWGANPEQNDIFWVGGSNYPALDRRWPGLFKDLLWIFKMDGDDWFVARSITLSETRRAAEKVGYSIQFPDYCYDMKGYLYYEDSDGPLELKLSPKDLKWFRENVVRKAPGVYERL